MATHKRPKPKFGLNRRPVGAVVISDMHVGGTTALWPPDGKLESGNIVGHGDNAHQRWLWQVWQNTIQTVQETFGNDPFALILNGDLVEGAHHHNKEVCAAIEADHMEAAIQLLQPLANLAAETHVIRGTECHTKDFERVIAKVLGANYCGDKAMLEIHGTLIDAAHHMPTSGRAYLEAGSLSILMGNARLNYARVGHRLPKVFLRAHRHVGGFYSDGTAMIVSTGAYQLLTRWAKKVVGESICRPAFAILDWRTKPKNSLPSVTLPTYDPHQEKITVC
jgi:hypothetical protein